MRARPQVDAAARIKGRPHARPVIVEMPPSRFIVRRRSIRSSPRMHACTHVCLTMHARTHARSHVRTSRATVRVCRIMHLPVRIRRRVINATSADSSHLYRKRHVACIDSRRGIGKWVRFRCLFEILPRCVIWDFFRFLLVNASRRERSPRETRIALNRKGWRTYLRDKQVAFLTLPHIAVFRNKMNFGNCSRR